MSNIIQNTPEWLQAKKSKVGASEIYTLVYHYCKSDLEAMGINLAKEKPFKSALEIFIKIKHGVENNDIGEVNSVFGKEMEPYIANRLGRELEECSVEKVDYFEINELLHPLAACSPDGDIEISDPDAVLQDYDKTCKISAASGRGVVELKTTPYTFNFDAVSGAKWSYIFQLQYQMMVCKTIWGVLAAIAPDKEEYDSDFFKGQVIGMIRLKPESELDFLDQYYRFYYYVYPAIASIWAVINKALAAFQRDLDADNYPEISLSDLVKLQREKKLLGMVWPDRFGEIKADPDLDDLINQRMVAHREQIKADTEKAEFDNKIILATRKFTKIVGSQHKVVYDKRGSMRFSQVSLGKC